jgi:hypothetical protein
MPSRAALYLPRNDTTQITRYARDVLSRTKSLIRDDGYRMTTSIEVGRRRIETIAQQLSTSDSKA